MGTWSALPGALVTIFSMTVCFSYFEGVNFTDMVQLSPVDSVGPQPF